MNSILINIFDSIGKIVLANRGECLFEDKTLVAQKEGALGVIIRNNEVRFWSL